MFVIGCDFHTRFQQIAMMDPPRSLTDGWGTRMVKLERFMEVFRPELEGFDAGSVHNDLGLALTDVLAMIEVLAERLCNRPEHRFSNRVSLCIGSVPDFASQAAVLTCSHLDKLSSDHFRLAGQPLKTVASVGPSGYAPS